MPITAAASTPSATSERGLSRLASLSVGQRITLTLGLILTLFMLTSASAYYSFSSVGRDVGVVVNKASPRVYLSGNLRGNLAETQYLLLQLISGHQADGTRIEQRLKGLGQAFEQDFAQLKRLGVKGVDDAEQLSAQIFRLAAQMVQSQSTYQQGLAVVEAQRKDFKYLTSEMGYTLEDLLYEEFRYEYLSLLKPIRDDIAFMNTGIRQVLLMDNYTEAQAAAEDIQRKLASIDKAIARAPALDQEVADILNETWLPFKAQLTDPNLSLQQHLAALKAMQQSEQQMVSIEQLVAQSEQQIAGFIQSARDQAASATTNTLDTLSQGKSIIVLGALAAMLLSLFLGIRLIRYLQKALARLVGAIGRIADGDLTTRVPVEGNDEITQVAVSTNTLAQHLHDLVDQISHTVQAVHDAAQISQTIGEQTLTGAEQQSTQTNRLAATASEMEASAR
ncbi:MAG: methyl-accepting chemotaxis protein, partial [Oceanospirillum sp.]|nr:methyl-accepting chemotaxis protein [Oceanospirillum sp.]